MKTQRKIALASLSLLIGLSACTDFNPLGGESRTRLSNWSDDSHSNSATPNYDKIFAENTVHRMDITISASDWALMQENMTEMYGSSEQGQRPEGRPGGVPGEAPAPGEERVRPEGGGPGGGGGGGGGLLESEENPIYRPATVRYEDKTWEHVGIRYKGNSSLRSSWGQTQKLPFRFDFDEFEDDHPEVHNQRFYGFKRLSFSSNWSDDTLIREKLAPDIFRKAGVPAARTAFYRLFIDHGEGSEYFGLYTMVEVPDGPMFQQQFIKDGGNLYKPSGSGAQFGTFEADHFPKKTNEKQADFSDIQSIFSALNADRSDAALWRKNLEAVFDVDGFLKYLAVNNVIQNWDTYGRMEHNYYLYTDPGDQLTHWIPWDHNMSLGGDEGAGGGGGGNRPEFERPVVEGQTPVAGNVAPPERPQGQGGGGRGPISLGMEEVDDSWPLIRYLMDDATYFQKYKALVETTAQQAFNQAEIQSTMRSLHELIRPYVTGAEGEREEATLLSSPEAFDSGFDALLEHVDSQHTAVQEFLATE